MGVNYFTEAQVEELRNNPYVKNVSIKAITYSDDFKREFLSLKALGKSRSEIFKICGFNPKVIGKHRLSEFSRRVSKMANRPEGICDLREQSGGRPRKVQRTPEQELAYLQHKIKYLEQENDFLKKINLIDKKAVWQQKIRQDKNSK